jgi:hypothetical protein
MTMGHLAMMTEDIQAAVPALNDPLVQTFIQRFQLTNPPVHLDFVDCGYDADQCHLSAKHRAMTKGGRRVHGWAVWKFDDMLVGEHHSVWENLDKELVDITPPKFGNSRVLFVRDDQSDLIEMEGIFIMWADRTTIPGIPFGFQGSPHDEATWGLSPDNTHIVAFCQKYDLTPRDMLTDERFG